MGKAKSAKFSPNRFKRRVFIKIMERAIVKKINKTEEDKSEK